MPLLAYRVLRGALVAASLAFIGTYVTVAVLRIGYPFELEWMEGVMVDHARRLLAGQPIYPKPSLDFVSLLYPPLYYAASAGVAAVVDGVFLPLRLLSLLSSLGVFALLAAIVRRETGSMAAGILAAGLFAASYEVLGRWFDLARLDSFYLCVLLASVFVLRRARSTAAALAAAVLMVAAFLTKQSALVIFVPVALGALGADWRRAVWFVGATAAMMGASVVVLHRMTDGWFTYYCFTMPANHPGIPGAWTAYWTSDLPVLGVGCLAAGVYLARHLWSREILRRLYYPLFAAGMLGSSWSVRTMVGAEVNNLMPVYAAISILAACGLHEVRQLVDQSPRRALVGIGLAAELLFLAQFASLRYDPRASLPTPADRSAGSDVAARIAAVDGEVFVPHHGYLARLAGKPGFAHTLAMDNVFLDDHGPARADLENELVRAINEGRFAAVVIESDRWRASLIRSHYGQCAPLIDDPAAFWPRAGAHLRPASLCLPGAP